MTGNDGTRDRTGAQLPNDPEKLGDSNLLVIAKGAGISFFGSWMGQAAALVAGLVVARALGAEQYGLYTLGIVVVMTLGGLSVVGLPLAAQRYVAIFRSEGDSGGTKGVILASLSIVGLISALSGALLFSFSGFIGETVFGKPELTQVFQVLTVAVPLLSVTSVAISCTYAFRTTKYGVLVQNILNPWSRLIVAVILLALGWGLGGVLVAYLVAGAISLFLALYYLNRLFPLRTDHVKASFRPRLLLSFGLPVFGAGALGMLQAQADIFLLGLFSTTANVGIYKVGLLLASMIPAALVSLNTIFAPMISDLFHRGQIAELESLFRSITRWSVGASLPVSLVFVLTGGPLLSMFGSGFSAGATSLAVLAAGQLVNAAAGPVGALLLMTGSAKLNLANQVVTLVFTSALGLVLIPGYGLLGAAVAAASGLALLNLIVAFEVHVLLGIRFSFTGLWKPVASALAAGGLSYLVSNYLFPAVGIAMIAANVGLLLGTYAAALWLLGVESEDRVVATALKSKLAAAVAYR